MSACADSLRARARPARPMRSNVSALGNTNRCAFISPLKRARMMRPSSVSTAARAARSGAIGQHSMAGAAARGVQTGTHGDDAGERRAGWHQGVCMRTHNRRSFEMSDTVKQRDAFPGPEHHATAGPTAEPPPQWLFAAPHPSPSGGRGQPRLSMAISIPSADVPLYSPQR